MRTHTKETQSSLTPEMAFQILKEGNQRFAKISQSIAIC